MAKSGIDTSEGKTALSHSNQRKRVDIKPLKFFAFEKFPKDCALRDVLLAEQDFLNAEEFAVKMEIWLKLLRRIH